MIAMSSIGNGLESTGKLDKSKPLQTDTFLYLPAIYDTTMSVTLLSLTSLSLLSLDSDKESIMGDA